VELPVLTIACAQELPDDMEKSLVGDALAQDVQQ
jgi:hypothetical protein